MSEEKITREEFDELYEEVLELAKQLGGKERHSRGGTTLGEAFASEAFVEAWVATLSDPLYIQHNVDRYLGWWCGERDVWAARPGKLLEPGLRAPGIATLGKQRENGGEQFPGPEEIGLRASRAKSMTERKAEPRIAALYEHAKLCLDLAEAFEKRLEDEGGIRRVQ